MSGQKGLLFCFLVGEGNPRMTELNVAHISAVAAKRIPFFLCLCGGPATLKIKSHTKKRRTMRGPLANKKQVGGKHNCFGLFLNSTGRRCWPRRVCAIFQSLSHINLKSQSNLHKICFLIRYSRQPEVRGSGARRIRDDGQHGGAKVSGKRNPSPFLTVHNPIHIHHPKCQRDFVDLAFGLVTTHTYRAKIHLAHKSHLLDP